MIKPLWAVAGVALLGTAGIAGALVVASSGGEEEVLQQVETATPSASASPESSPSAGVAATPTPTASPDCGPATPENQIWRWGDVIVTIPKGNGVRAMGDIHDGKPVLIIFPEVDSDEWTVIDAETGAVGPPRPNDDPQREKEAEVQAAAASATICTLDPKTAPWPYTGEAPEARAIRLGL